MFLITVSERALVVESWQFTVLYYRVSFAYLRAGRSVRHQATSKSLSRALSRYSDGSTSYSST
eukprot:5360043-Pyramimonas_sp.AAC.1